MKNNQTGRFNETYIGLLNTMWPYLSIKDADKKWRKQNRDMIELILGNENKES